ncbi:MAG: shikimate dehydrogenase [Pseudomonadota bacterium]
MKLGVIGHPINHSKSPIIHNQWLKDHGIDGEYTAIDIAPDNLEKDIKDYIEQGLSGFNVTVPHKQSVLSLCSSLEATAAAIGAVNTIIVSQDGIKGFNTDAYGFLENIRQNSNGFEFRNKTAFILGAGGAAKAIIYGLLESGVQKIILTNRTYDKAQNLQEFDPYKIECVTWDEKERFLHEADLLVNTTSLGMVGHKELELDLSSLKKGAIVNDIVYAPLETNLLKQARLLGYETVTGIGMLLYQAQKSFEIWTGIVPKVDQSLINKVMS